jgi:chlorite dismutase
MRATIAIGVLLASFAVGTSLAAEREKLLTEPGVYVTFAVFQVDERWRALEGVAKEATANAVREVFKKHADRVAADSYLSRGLADRADFFVRLHAAELAHNQALLVDLLATPMGRHLNMIGSFIGLTKKTNYVPGLPEEMKTTLKTPADVGGKPYAIMIPVRKDAGWWLMDKETRQKQIQEHTQASLPYLKTVKRKLYHSTGLDDFDFLTYFETAKLEDFHNLILALQSVEEFKHVTRLGHPILLGTATPLDELLTTLSR